MNHVSRVAETCTRIWELRERPADAQPRKLTRSLLLAMHHEMDVNGGYNPACDHRVKWSLLVLDAMEKRQKPEIDPDLEAVVAMLIGKAPELRPCGIDRAAGSAGG
ncbi:MAG: hypothetical protein RLZZ408_140 [Verrucomicrobiota bacterium]|jgi:hypothetical protein